MLPASPRTGTIESSFMMIERVESAVRWVGLAAACVLIPAQLLVSLSYVVGRHFFNVPVTALQELEWHCFFALLFLACGAALLADRHVRIDLLRQRVSARIRARIEITGFFIGLLPFCLALIGSGTLAAWDAFLIGETSRAAMGLPGRWVIKSTVPLGGALLLAAGCVLTVRNMRLIRCLPASGMPPAVGASDSAQDGPSG